MIKGMMANLRAAAISALVLVAPAQAQTLSDTLVAAYTNSGLLDQQRALLRATDEGVAQAVAALRPVINYSLNATYSDPRPTGDRLSANLGVSAQMLLFDFGNSRLAREAAKETVLATREALRGVEQQVLLRAAAAYFNLRRQIAIQSLRENNVRLISEQLRAASDRFEVGEVTRTDVALAEARLASARSGLAAAQGAVAQARAEYAAVTGTAPGANLAAPPRTPATAATLDGALASARQRHPDIAQAQRQVTVAELNVEAAQTAVLPRLEATGSLSVDNDGDDASSIGLSFRGPIYQGGALSSRVRQVMAQRDAARADLLQTRRAIDQNVANAWADVQVADATVIASELQVRAATVAFRGVQEELEVGQRTTLDVLDFEQELLDARTSQVSATIDRDIAAYQLLSAMGLLSASHLDLGVLSYDPTAYYNAVEGGPVGLVSPQGEQLDRILRALGRN